MQDCLLRTRIYVEHKVEHMPHDRQLIEVVPDISLVHLLRAIKPVIEVTTRHQYACREAWPSQRFDDVPGLFMVQARASSAEHWHDGS